MIYRNNDRRVNEETHKEHPMVRELQRGLSPHASLARQFDAQDEKLLTVREVAKKLRVDDTTVRRWIKNGVLEAISLPHRNKRQAYRVKESTLDALLSVSTIDAINQ